MQRIAVFGKRRQSPEDVPAIETLFATLEGKGVYTLVESNFYTSMSKLTGKSLPADDVFDSGEPFRADFCLSIGGDGTFLRTARSVAEKEIPIIGFNTGHLGFLAEESIDDAPRVIDALVGGHYTIEGRAVLQGRAFGENLPAEATQWNIALNEIAILRQDTASMIAVETRLDEMPVACYRGDGLIISTPTGSTAYNLSVGGPIVEPTAPCWVLSPIAPHSLTMRPLVVADSHDIDIKVVSRTDTYRVTLDGRTLILPVDTPFKVRRAPFDVRVVHLPDHRFIDTLRTKLLWGMSKRPD